MGEHAILSPSGASRWMACTPSARLEMQFPDTAGRAAAEGTHAHSLAELLIRMKLKMIKKHQYEIQLAAIKASDLYDPSMLDYCEEYADFVVERFFEAQARTKDAQIFLESKIDLTTYIPEGFGTADVVIVADGTLYFIDLKYGKGKAVFAENNPQLMIYASGILDWFDVLYDVQKMSMTIHQPRLDSVSTFEMSADDLRKWAETELTEKARLAFDGQGEFTPGKHCEFCRAKGACKALAELNLAIAKYNFKEPELLEPEEISDILDRAKLFVDWIGGVQTYALREAINGTKWPGYKVVEGKSNRIYSDVVAVEKALTDKGFSEDVIFEKKLHGITKMEKAIGKATFNEALGDLIIKPAGKPTLAPLSDKRPEMNSLDAAAADFADELDN